MDQDQVDHHVVVSEVDIIVGSNEDVSLWEVDILLDGVPHRYSLGIMEPLDDISREISEWYLEEYAAKSPLERQKAQKAEGILQAYSTKLLDQLCLQELIQLGETSSVSRKLFIDVIDMIRPLSLSSSTLHRLYWELLESPSLWPASFTTVIVRRRSVYGASKNNLIDQNLGLQIGGVTKSSFNVLLVIARDLSRDTSTYEDVKPFVALDILISLKKRLDGSGSRSLKVHVVRPGSLQAFRRHLNLIKAEHGSRYYDLVHFDVHGRVAIRKSDGQKIAWLLFLRPGFAGLQPIAAERVAEILQEHRVRFVVFNACDSAKSSTGLNANVAATLSAKGVHGVLAMSFKLLSSAAVPLLSSFYEELLVKNKPFAEAAGAARYHVRKQPSRLARFGLRINVEDWIIPVVYIHDDDAPAFRTRLRENSSTNDDTVVSNLDQRLNADFVGRELEILRLEDTLVQEKMLYMTGRAGAGKTALVQHVVKTWRETEFTERVAYIYLAHHIKTLSQFVERLQASLKYGNGTTNPSEQKDHHALDLELVQIEILSKSTTIVIDNLDYYQFVHFARQIETSCLQAISQFLQALWEKSVADSRAKPFYVLFVGKQLNSWWKEHFGALDVMHIPLPQLSLAHAVSLADTVLRKAGGDGAWQNGRAIEGVILLVELLQRNPLSIKLVLPHVVQSKLAVSDFYTSLLTGELDLATFFTEEEVLRSRSNLVQTLRNSLKDFMICRDIHPFCAAGLFWERGPHDYVEFSRRLGETFRSIPTFSQEPSTIGLSDEPSHISWFMLHEILAFQTDATSLRWIHPLTTIMLRKLLQDRLQLQSAEWVRNLYRSYLTAVNELIAHLHPNPPWTLSGLVKEEQFERTKTSLPNVLFALHVCLRNDLNIDVDDWPIDFGHFFVLLATFPGSSMVSLRPYLREMIERLLKREDYRDWTKKMLYLLLSMNSAYTSLATKDMERWTPGLFEMGDNIFTLAESSGLVALLPEDEADLELEISIRVQIYHLCPTVAMGYLTRGRWQNANHAWRQYHLIQENSGIEPSGTVENLLDELLEDWSPTTIDLATCVEQAATLVRALDHSDSGAPGALQLSKGDIISVIGPDKSGWCKGVLKSQVGIFQSSRVELITQPTTEEAEKNYQDIVLAAFIMPVHARLLSRQSGETDVAYQSRRIRVSERIHLLRPVQPDLQRWEAWGRGDIFELNTNDFEVLSDDSEGTDLTESMIHEPHDPNSNIAWDWIRKRMSGDPSSKSNEFPFPSLRKYIALVYHERYKSYLRNKMANLRSFKREIVGDELLCSVLNRAIEQDSALPDKATQLLHLEAAEDSGDWWAARTHHHILADQAGANKDWATWIYHIKKLLALYKGIEEEQAVERRKKLEVQEKLARMLACEEYVRGLGPRERASEHVQYLVECLVNGDRWVAAHSDIDMQDLDMQEAWMKSYGPACEFDLGLDL